MDSLLWKLLKYFLKRKYKIPCTETLKREDPFREVGAFYCRILKVQLGEVKRLLWPPRKP